MGTLARIRVWLVLFVIGLVLSGITAFPLEAESRLLADWLHAGWSPAPVVTEWVDRIHVAIARTNRESSRRVAT